MQGKRDSAVLNPTTAAPAPLGTKHLCSPGCTKRAGPGPCSNWHSQVPPRLFRTAPQPGGAAVASVALRQLLARRPAARLQRLPARHRRHGPTRLRDPRRHGRGCLHRSRLRVCSFLSGNRHVPMPAIMMAVCCCNLSLRVDTGRHSTVRLADAGRPFDIHFLLF
jgi:hypothetical protein